MKLYFAPGACSFAVHATINELGLNCEAIRVDLAKKKTFDDQDFIKINPKGYVPALKLPNGQVMTEVSPILQFLADQKPDTALMPKAGTPERYEMLELLNYLSTEVHKTMGAMFAIGRMVSNQEAVAEFKENNKKLIARRLSLLAERLSSRPYLMGTQVTVADFYLLTLLRWSGMIAFDLSPFEPLKQFVGRMTERPSVQKAIKAEGLPG